MCLRLLTTGALAVLAIAIGCGGDDLVLPGDGDPATVVVLEGDGQSGRVGEALAEPLIAQVLDGADRPVSGATLVVEIDGAAAEPDTVVTAGDGKASVAITLGSAVGEAGGVVRVTAPEGPTEIRTTFTVEAVAASANGLTAVSGQDQTGSVGTELPDPLVVEVTDAFGNPIPGVPISWTVEGGGAVSEAATSTGADGRTSVIRTLGPTAGTQSTTATSEGLAGSPLVFTHTVTAGSAAGVLIVAGNNQVATPGSTLPDPLVVRVVDQEGNAVVGAAVTWVVTAGSGSVAPNTGTTADDGSASTAWTLGAAAGANTLQAIVSGVGQADFSATAAAGAASKIRIVSGDGQSGAAGGRLTGQLVVQVFDDADNPVGGVAVTFAVLTGGGSVSPTSAPTGADGRAATAWTLGSSIGAQQVRATATGAGSVQFDATSTAGAPAVLGLTTQPSARPVVGVPFPRQPVIQVRDAAGNPVQAAGVTITAAIASGAGQIGGTTSQTTGANGRATFTNLEIAGATGSHRLIFAAAGFSSVTSNAIDVEPGQTTTRITSDSPDPSAPGQGVEVVFQVTSPSGTPTGTVQVTASGGNETCSADVATGRCTIVLNGAGNRTLTARYTAAGVFSASSGNTGHSVVVPNTPPTALDDGYAATAGVLLTVPAPGVLENDSDPDDPISAQLLTNPGHGTLTFNGNGSFTYLPDPTFFGQDRFTYQVTGGSATASATVLITVNLPTGP